jgi:hypothetical protein
VPHRRPAYVDRRAEGAELAQLVLCWQMPGPGQTGGGEAAERPCPAVQLRPEAPLEHPHGRSLHIDVHGHPVQGGGQGEGERRQELLEPIGGDDHRQAPVGGLGGPLLDHELEPFRDGLARHQPMPDGVAPGGEVVP